MLFLPLFQWRRSEEEADPAITLPHAHVGVNGGSTCRVAVRGGSGVGAAWAAVGCGLVALSLPGGSVSPSPADLARVSSCFPFRPPGGCGAGRSGQPGVLPAGRARWSRPVLWAQRCPGSPPLKGVMRFGHGRPADVAPPVATFFPARFQSDGC